MMIERVAGEHAERDRDAVVVEEEPELDDGLLAVLLADAVLPESFPDDVPVGVRLVRIGTRDLEEEVRHVVEDDLRAASRAPRQAGVHALDYLLRMPLDDVERVVDVVVVGAGDERTEVLPVLLHRGRLGRRLEKPSVREEPDDPREVVADPRRELDAREEFVEAERPEDGVEDRRRHAPGLAEARRVSRVESDGDPAFRGSVDIGLQLLDERSARPVRFPQPTQVVRLAVVVP